MLAHLLVVPVLCAVGMSAYVLMFEDKFLQQLLFLMRETNNTTIANKVAATPASTPTATTTISKLKSTKILRRQIMMLALVRKKTKVKTWEGSINDDDDDDDLDENRLSRSSRRHHRGSSRSD